MSQGRYIQVMGTCTSQGQRKNKFLPSKNSKRKYKESDSIDRYKSAPAKKSKSSSRPPRYRKPQPLTDVQRVKDRDLTESNATFVKGFRYKPAYDEQTLMSQDEVLAKHTLSRTDIKCTEGNDITHVCLEPGCRHPSLTCNVPNCKKCSRRHERCCNLRFKAFTELITETQNRQRGFLKHMLDMENRLIKSIKESRQKMVERFTVCDLEQNYLDLINRIYFRKKKDAIKGREARELSDKLKSYGEQTTLMHKDLLQSYEEKTLDLAERFNLAKDQTLRDLRTSREAKQFDSHILAKGTESDQQRKFIEKSLGGPRSIALIFRASQHQFQAAQFHRLCDNLTHTFVLIKTEFDKVIGGYTPVPWNATNGSLAPDKHRQSFLLSLDSREKWPLKYATQSIMCQPNFGPCFGSSDIHIGDSCWFNVSSWSEFPDSYDGKYKLDRSGASRKLFCGDENGKFRVVEYEVFKVTF